MAKKLYEETAVANIANAIRNKNGQTTTYKIAEMAQAINNIPTGGGELPSFSFTRGELQNLFQNDRLTPLHDIGYTTSDNDKKVVNGDETRYLETRFEDEIKKIKRQL